MTHITLEEYLKNMIEITIESFHSTAEEISLKYPLTPEHVIKNCVYFAKGLFEKNFLENISSFKKVYYNLLLDSDEKGDSDEVKIETNFVEKVNFKKDVEKNFKHWISFIERSFSEYCPPEKSLRKSNHSIKLV